MDGTDSSELGDSAREGEIEAVTQHQDASAKIEGASLNENAPLENGGVSSAEETPVEVDEVSASSDVPSENGEVAPAEEAAAESDSADVAAEASSEAVEAAPVEEAVAESEVSAVAAEVSPETAETAPAEDTSVELDGASLMEQYLSDPSHDYKTLKYGDVVDGVIMRIDRDELLVDIGSKSEGIVPSREFSSLSAEEKQALGVGDNVLVFVVQPENQEGHAVVSIDRARQEKSWRKLQEIYEANEVIEAEVTNYNKGGLLVNLDGVRGFVPASQVSEIRGGDEASKQADMARLIGSSLPLKVIEINRHRNRLILSERQAIQERRDVMKERLIEELKEGEVRKGRVSSICDFGAFVDIGGADGLVHLSELSWSRVRHPGEVLKVGQEVDVYVLGINPQEKKIALSIKRTQAEPWSRVAAKYEVGQLVRGVVTQLANFGAFARIEDGIEGLIHVSELADERITHPKQVVREGQELLLRIIRIDPERRRMGLSLRRALDTPDAELETVFGEGVLEERDRIVQQIREALEAEGIDMSAPVEAPFEETETAEPGESTEVAAVAETEVAPAADDAPAADSVEAAPDEEPAVETPVAEATEVVETKPKTTTRKRSSTKATAEIPDDLDGEPLSAMAMAFAMAAPDLVVGDDAEPASDSSDASATDGGEEREA
jgi:small subunit ribosomal protein S1